MQADVRALHAVYSERPVSVGALFLGNSWCNIACDMCGNSKIKERIYWSRNDVRAFLDNYAHLNTLGMYNGEPTATPYFSWFVDECVKRDIRVTVSTNGTLLHTVIEAVKKCWQVQVSADGATKETYEALRQGKKGPGSNPYERWRSNLELLRGHPGAYLWFVYQKRNVGEMAAFVELAADVGMDRVFFSRVNQVDRRATDEDYRLNYDLAQVAGERLGVQVALGGVDKVSGGYVSNCHLATSAQHDIDKDCQAHPCVHRRESWGDVREKTAKEIWQNPRFVLLRHMLANNIKPSRCKCEHFTGLHEPNDPYDMADET